MGEQAADHVEILEGSATDGVLVPDLISDALDITPGERIVIGSPDEGTLTLPVGGIYRSLYKGGGASGYWRPWNDALVLYCGNCAPPPQAVIVPKDRFADAARAIGLDHAAYAWQAPLLRDLTLQEAEDAAGITSRISEDINDRDAARPVLHRLLLQPFQWSRVGERDGRRGPGRPRAARRDRRTRSAAADRRDARRAGGRRGGRARSRWPLAGSSRTCCSRGARGRGRWVGDRRWRP